MTSADEDDDEDEDAPPAGGPRLITGAALVYAFLIAAGTVWLSLRDRLRIVPELALGEYGLLTSAASGAGVGLGISAAFWVLHRYLPPFERLEHRLARMIGPLSESQILILSLVSAIGEEFFFRGAVQDAVGPVWSALVFGLLHAGPGGLWLWTLTALGLGLLLGWMMAAGLGLLSVTVTHALINYLSLRRMDLES